MRAPKERLEHWTNVILKDFDKLGALAGNVDDDKITREDIEKVNQAIADKYLATIERLRAGSKNEVFKL